MPRQLALATISLSVLLAATPLVGQAEPAEARPAWAHDLDAPLAVDSLLTVGHLDNGLTYYVRENREPERRAEIWLLVDAGSNQEDEDQRGLAHFVEHMAFNGTERFPRQELIDYLERTGMRFGPDINAYTSFEETVYMLKVPTDEPGLLETGLEILREWAHGVSFVDQEVDKERGVVVEEWRLGLGAESRIRDKQFPTLFKDSRYAERLPIGQKDILETAPVETLQRFYREWYRPNLMAVIAVGDFDRQRVEELMMVTGKQSTSSATAPNPCSTWSTWAPSHCTSGRAGSARSSAPTGASSISTPRKRHSNTSSGWRARFIVSAAVSTCPATRRRAVARGCTC